MLGDVVGSAQEMASLSPDINMANGSLARIGVIYDFNGQCGLAFVRECASKQKD